MKTPAQSPSDRLKPQKRNSLADASLILKIAIPVAIILGAFQTYFYLKATKPQIPSQARAERVWPVRAEQVTFRDYQPELKLYGEVISGRQVELRALVSGKIIDVNDNFRSGGIVQQNETLLQIDPFPYEAALTDAKASLREARAKLNEITASVDAESSALEFEQEQLQLGERDLRRAQPLVKDGTVTKRVLDERKLIVSQRKQNVETRKKNLQVQLARAEQQSAIIERWEWSVKVAERNLNDTRLIAPFDANLSGVTAQVGRMVSANDNVATLLDKNWIDVRFTLSDAQYGRILAAQENIIGRKVAIRWRVGTQPLTYQAVIERTNPQVSSQSGGVEVFARVRIKTNNAQSSIELLKSGAFVEVIVPDRLYENVVRLPQTALFETTYVYTITNDRLTKRKVELIGTVGDNILIRGDLKSGEQILLTRLSVVGDGVKVQIVEQAQSAPEEPRILSKKVDSEKG